MKVAAHPLVVAVAMGLLAPTALEAVDDVPSPCADCGSDADDVADDALAMSLLTNAHLAELTSSPALASVGATADSVDAWLALPIPAPDVQARALLDYESAV